MKKSTTRYRWGIPFLLCCLLWPTGVAGAAPPAKERGAAEAVKERLNQALEDVGDLLDQSADAVRSLADNKDDSDRPADSAGTAAAGGTGVNPADSALNRREASLVAPETRGKTPRVYQVELDEEVDRTMVFKFRRALLAARKSGAQLLLVELNTPGGDLNAMTQIKDELLEAPMTTAALVRRAGSAGALIALACDNIFMTPGAVIGGATPVLPSPEGIKSIEDPEVREKIYSFMLSEFAATADAKHHRADLARAFVDRRVAIDGLDDEEHLLTLTAEQAVEEALAIAVVRNAEGVYQKLALPDPQVEKFELRSSEKFALTVSNWAFIFLAFGMIGLFTEIRTPGFGIPGILGLISLGLFFWAYYVLESSGWFEIILFGIGLALLLLELFVIPGFGIAGISGILCLLASVLFAMIEFPADSMTFSWGQLHLPLQNIALALLIFAAGTVLSMQFLPNTGIFSQITLKATLAKEAGFVSGPRNEEWIGADGVTQTVMRPSGMVLINGRRMDARAESSFLEKNTPVRVVAVDGSQLVVKPLPQEQRTDA